MQTQTDVIGQELERVVPNMATAYDFDDEFFSSIEKRPVEIISGRDMRVPLKLRPGGYFGYFDAANGDLGAGGAQKYEKGVISTVNMKIAIQWDLQSQWGTDDRRKALVNNVTENLADAMSEFRRQSEAQCMTNGTGVIATVTSETTGTFTCTTDGYRVKLLRPGQRVSVYNAARTTNRTASGPIEITSVDVQANTFVATPTVAGVIATDVILPEGLTGSTPVGLYGVPYHASSSTSGSWLGLTRSTTPEIVGNRVNANSAALALPFGRLALNKVGDRIGMKKKYKPTAWMHPCQLQAYEALGQLVSMIQKQAKNESFDLYFGDGAQLAGCPIRTSYLYDKKRIDFIINEFWGRAEMKSIGFHEVGGRKLFEMRGPSGGVAASIVTYIVASWNLFNKNPASTSYIDSLEIPDGY